jgi:hypothetical protein
MPPEPSFEDIDRELRRIGFDDDEMPGLVLPHSVSLADFLELLRAIPTDAGIEAFDELMASLPWPRPAPWDEWPDPGNRFSLGDYVAALRLINYSPEEDAEDYVTPPRKVPTWLFALLSLVSPEMAARVDEYRAEVRQDRLAAGVSPEVVETADDNYERIREELTETARQVEEARRESNGPAILFRLGPELTHEEARVFFHEAFPDEFCRYRAWITDRGPDGTWACLFLPKSIAETQRQLIEQWLRDQPRVREVRVSPVRVWESPPSSNE